MDSDPQRFDCAGNNDKCQLGILTAADTCDGDPLGDDPSEMGDALPFINFGPGKSVRFAAAGHDHACAVLTNNELYCWGIPLPMNLALVAG